MSAGPNDPQSEGTVAKRSIERVESVTIRFAGDSGDGMQLTGSQFTSTTAAVGNDLATLPDFPAEIRAPAGTLAGVSGFQIQFGSTEIFTPGDRPDVLVAMNPAALKSNLADLERGATIIVNKDAFDKRSLEKVGFASNPLDDGTLADFQVIEVAVTTLTQTALESSPLSHRDKERSKNFFALGLMYWLYNRPMDHTLQWVTSKFGKMPEVAAANVTALKAGFHYGETAELFANTYEVQQASIEPGLYRQITGNQATAYGFITAAQLMGIDLFLGSYPITPASDILHELSRFKNYNVRTFQAEDEIAAIGSAIGAAYGGALGLTTSSGPGIALKSEAISLAIMVELPLVIVDVQRGGPSTGLPTKTEQADLFQAIFGRHGEAPLAVIAAATPADCFWMAIEAARIATKYMTPVLLLTDGYLANGAEPWRLPERSDLPDLSVEFQTDPDGFQPYKRDPDTLARRWVRPGTPGLEHRVGGLEKADVTGHVSYSPANHEHMIYMRAAKIDGIAKDIPPAEVFGDPEGDLLIVGWGGTYGALHMATKRLRAQGRKVSHMHLRHMHPMPSNVGEILGRFKKVVSAELNLGQLRTLLRAKFLRDVAGINKVQGLPFRVSEIVEQAEALLASNEVTR
jgi:2-oxoglutarate ferredoxin oxidoreductase subunit alpha